MIVCSGYSDCFTFNLHPANVEELEEFDESPHVVHGDTIALTSDGIHADDEDVIFTRPLKNGATYSNHLG